MRAELETKETNMNRLSLQTFWIAVGIIACLSTILGALGRGGWFLDLFSNFPSQYLVMLGLSLLFLAKAKNRPWFKGVFSLFFLINGYHLLSPHLTTPGGAPSAIEAQKPIRVMAFNVLYRTQNQEQTSQAIKDLSPDIVVLTETHDEFIKALRPVTDQYQTAVVSKGNGIGQGIALFSRFPNEGCQIEEPEDSAIIPQIRCRLLIDSRPVEVFGVHLYPPTTPYRYHLRNQHLDFLEDRLATVSGDAMVLGDFNITPWSPYLRDFLEATNLRDSSEGMGLFPTWPTLAPMFWIPIDHVFHTRDLEVVSKWVGDNIGSDHFPILVDFSMRKKKVDLSTSPMSRPSAQISSSDSAQPAPGSQPQ